MAGLALTEARMFLELLPKFMNRRGTGVKPEWTSS
jgi:hypothetical protein